MAIPHPRPAATALVTGASSGIGEEAARQLAARSHNVVLVARREDRLAALAAELHDTHGVRAEVLACDLGDARRNLVEQVGALGLDVDILVNSAGYARGGPFARVPAESHAALLRTNLEAMVELTGAFVGPMAERRRGAILNVSSFTGFAPMPGIATYSATKVQGPELTARLEEACRTGGATLHGTGVHPGFMFERLGMTLTGLFTRVDHVRVVEAFECLSLLGHGGPKYLRASGFGTAPESLGPDSVVARWTNPYYQHVIEYAGKALFGAEPDEIRFENDVRGVPADEDTDAFPNLRIEKGQTLVVCLEHRGYLGDHHFFTNEEYWYPGLDNRYLGARRLPFGSFAGTSNYVVEIDGKPGKVSMQLDLASDEGDPTPAISYCSAIPLLQSIVPVCAARPGILYPENAPHYSVDYRSLAGRP